VRGPARPGPAQAAVCERPLIKGALGLDWTGSGTVGRLGLAGCVLPSAGMIPTGCVSVWAHCRTILRQPVRPLKLSALHVGLQRGLLQLNFVIRFFSLCRCCCGATTAALC
jgi:hypothetical protein